MLFGRPFASTRPFDVIFRNRKNLQYVHHIFRQLSTELRGDSVASSQLYAAYQKQCCCVYKLMRDEALTEKYSMLDKIHFNTKPAQVFRRCFDMLCKNAFINCLTRWNDYTQPIIRDEDFLRYQEAAKHVFDRQWRFLASTRGLNRRRSEMTPALIAYKERQVFCQILTLMSISNRRELCHWRLINTANYYGLGISNTVINQSTFYGTTVSRTYRDTMFRQFSKNVIELQRKLLSQEPSASITFDNFQMVGQKLRDQRGGKTSKTLSGTHELAHRIWPYVNFSQDHLSIENTFDKNQPVMSPIGMRQYESVPLDSPNLGSRVFTNHIRIPCSPTPDTSGKRVRHHQNFTHIAKILNRMDHTFQHSTDHFEQLPSYIKKPHVHLSFVMLSNRRGYRI